jgi:hypothetical protein
MNTISFSVEYEGEDIDSWYSIIELTAKASEEFGISIRTLELHDGGKEAGLSVQDIGRVILFSHNKEIALHELAHLWAGADHDEEWAQGYFLLCKEYLNAEEFILAVWEAEKRYPGAKRTVQWLTRDGLIDEDGRWTWATPRASASQ